MCGIFSYLGKENAIEVCLEGLKRLEYRGYDSSGIAGVLPGELFVCKRVGKIHVLEAALKGCRVDLSCAIAHTRWATHGRPSEANAHPQLDTKKQVAVVHNGVIENYGVIKEHLMKAAGAIFSSDTDTEVIAQLISYYYEGDLFRAVQKASQQLEGAFAIGVIHKDHPNLLVAVGKVSPLVIGLDSNSKELFIASDPTALPDRHLELFFLVDGEIALLSKGELPRFYTQEGSPIQKRSSDKAVSYARAKKGDYEHFMLKEIQEQAETVRIAMVGRCDVEKHTAYFRELAALGDLSSIRHVVLIGCGSSWHASYIAQYAFENMAGISARAEIASEYRYKRMILEKDTLVIALSQSGETADTLACVREIKKKGVPILALCNTSESSLTRESDATILLGAGQEVAVASTKTFTSQLIILSLLALYFARKGEMNTELGRLFLKRLYEIPSQVHDLLLHSYQLETLSKKYAHFEDMYFLGRDILYPTALESALKLKEIAYINAVGYPAGEMKHGPIALLSPDLPVIIFCAHERLQAKIMSNLMESKARGSPIIVFGWRKFSKQFSPFADDEFFLPETCDELSCILLTISTQLFAYYVAKQRKAEIDQPRNLAKSVTVE